MSKAARVAVRRLGRHRDGADGRYRDRHGYWHSASWHDHMEAVGRLGLEERLPRAAGLRVRPGDWVIDVGANVGLITADLCARVGCQGIVWAIEPIPSNIRRLETLQRGNDLPQLRVVPAALSDRTGQANLRLPRGGQSGWASFTKSWDMGAEIAVATWRLDDLRPEFPDRRLSLLKLDVEGFEPQVIAGATETLACHRPVVVCEFNEILLRDAGSSSRQLAGALSRLGYRPLTRWRPRRRTQDLVFVPLSRGERSQNALLA